MSSSALIALHNYIQRHHEDHSFEDPEDPEAAALELF
jgi:hypothetical protein